MSVQEVPKQIVPIQWIKSHNDWRWTAMRLQFAVAVIGLCAIASSILVAAFTTELQEFGTRVAAALSALSAGVLAYFQLPKKLDDTWKGWKHFNAFIPLYEAGKIDLQRLSEEYVRAEKMVGVMETKPESMK